MASARRSASKAGLTAAAVLLGSALALAADASAAEKKKTPKTPETTETQPTPSVPPPPVPPVPGMVPAMPHPPKTTPRYNLKDGEIHKGDLYFASESVVIGGEQQGDLWVFAREVEVSGEVTGDLNAWVQSADLSGKLGDTVRVFCQDLKVTGTINGDLIAACANVDVDKSAHIKGDLTATGADIELHGDVDGDLQATGGEVTLSGRIGGDAELKADVVDVDPETRIHGDLDYTSRSKVHIDKDTVVNGKVTYSPEAHKPPVSKGGFFKWFFWMATALLSGLGAMTIFKKSAPTIVGAVQGDALRSAGIGFITAIVFPVAAAISCIFIITIPAVVLALIAFGLMLYLAQMPVAVWLGDFVMRRIGRGEVSHLVALCVGIPLMYVVFAIPVIGKIALFVVIFTGFGAVVMTIWAARQARRAGGGPPVPPPPVASVPA